MSMFMTTFRCIICLVGALIIAKFTGVTIDSSAAASEGTPPPLAIRLPERTRLLSDQLFDLVVESNRHTPTSPTLATASVPTLILDGKAWVGLPKPQVQEMVIGQGAATNYLTQWRFRTLSLENGGLHRIDAIFGSSKVSAYIGVQEFKPKDLKSLILFIGDGMGTAYRDVGRIVGQSANKGMREGFYDKVLQMDQMPVSGMVMTHAFNSLVPDSANTASALTTGNKENVGSLGVLPDGDDVLIDGGDEASSLKAATNNPRVESLWEYLKRRHGYRTGVITTAAVTDATPAAAYSHVATRKLQYEIARQFRENSWNGGPVIDVLMGGGRAFFDKRLPALAGDQRSLVTELTEHNGMGYRYIQTRTQLKKEVIKPGTKILGLFHDSDMTVTYDKLGYQRPSDESSSVAAEFPDQPFLDEMTEVAIKALGGDGKPFILMVEGAQIDKESHKNAANGVFWEVLEFDRSIGVGRAFARTQHGNVLTVVTADHDQTMTLLGVSDTEASGSIQNLRASMSLDLQGRDVSKASVKGQVHNAFPDYHKDKDATYPLNNNRYRMVVGFRTGDHTATSVPITAEGPGALLFTGYMDQTDVFFKMSKVLGADVSSLNHALETVQKMTIQDRNAAVNSH